MELSSVDVFKKVSQRLYTLMEFEEFKRIFISSSFGLRCQISKLHKWIPLRLKLISTGLFGSVEELVCLDFKDVMGSWHVEVSFESMFVNALDIDNGWFWLNGLTLQFVTSLDKDSSDSLSRVPSTVLIIWLQLLLLHSLESVYSKKNVFPGARSDNFKIPRPYILVNSCSVLSASIRLSQVTTA